MNLVKARNILNLSNNFTEIDLRKNYLSESFKYHPDKNLETDTKDKFQEINIAYHYLKNINTNNTNNTNNSKNETYTDLFDYFLNIILEKNNDVNKDDIYKLVEYFKNKCNEISDEILNNLSKDKIIKIYKYIYYYSDILNFNNDSLVKIKNILKKKLENDSIIILNPSLKNILENELYKLYHDNNLYYIPLWNNKYIIDLPTNTLIVYCFPELPKNIWITNNYTLNINIYKDIKSILKEDFIYLTLNNLTLNIPIKNLYIKEYQIYTLKNIGISEVNIDYELIYKHDIIIHLHLF